MRKKTLLWIFVSTSLIVLMSAGSLFAAGFALYEGSARGFILGAGLTATADDASAVFYNPAGITQLKGKQTMFGVTAINPMMNVKTNGTYATLPTTPATILPPGTAPYTDSISRETGMTNNWFWPPHAYLTWQHTDRLYSGYGIFTRFGLGTEFPGTWPGRYNSTYARVTTLELNPNIAYKVTNTISLAAGVSAMYLDANLQKMLDTRLVPGYAGGDGNDTHFELSGDSWGFGFNLAAHWKPTDAWSAGISYRSRVKHDVEGDMKVNRAIPLAGISDTTGSVDIDLPSMIFAGVAFKPVKTLTIGAGVYWTEWSSYDKFEVNFDQPFKGQYKNTTVKDWDNVFRYMIGAEWNVTPNWDLRLSYAYDEAPEPDNTVSYELPDNDRHQFAVGGGWHSGPWSVDLTYMYIMFVDRDVAARPADYVLQGEFEGYAHLISFSLGYKF